jgi:hypothetical protein
MDFGDFRRLDPLSRVFGADRGRPIDRHYIEGFMESHAHDVQGRVLEFGDATYTHRYGGARVTTSDVVHPDPKHPGATLTADLAVARSLGVDRYDCIVCTQVLMYVYEIRAAIATLHDALAPGGVVLATFPGISQISLADMQRFGEHWRFTRASAQRLFAERFGAGEVAVRTYGNVLAAIAFLQGLTVDELTVDELDRADPQYEVTIAVRACKSAVA